MPAYMTTIKEQIRELNPEKFAQMQASGELDKVLEAYHEQVVAARTAAAREARKKADESDWREPAASMNMAALSAQEIEMSQIMEELDYLYSTESPMSTD